MIAVSDSSPLIALARIGELELLAALFGRILVSADVREEVVDAGRGLPGAEEVRSAKWIEVAKVEPCEEGSLLDACAGLGAGERSTILLARTLSADVVLLDERKARRVAVAAGFKVAGCIGVLEAGARQGKVEDLRSAYLNLLRQGIRFDLGLLQESLGRLGLPPL